MPTLDLDALKQHETIEISQALWSRVRLALQEAERDLDDASSVVDPGEDEALAYEDTLEMLKRVQEEIEALPKTPARKPRL